MIVRIALPGLAKPVVVEDAGTELSMVVLADQHGYRFYIGSMVGVVVLASPLEGKGTGLWYPGPSRPACPSTISLSIGVGRPLQARQDSISAVCWVTASSGPISSQ